MSDGSSAGTATKAGANSWADDSAFAWSGPEQESAARAAWRSSLPDDPTRATGAVGERVGASATGPGVDDAALGAGGGDSNDNGGASVDAHAAVREALIAAGWITPDSQHSPDAADGETGVEGEAAANGAHGVTGADGTADADDEVVALGRDTRTPGQRRHDALIEMARVLAANPATMGDVRPTSAVKAQVTITMDYDRLVAGLGPGVDGHGTPLTAATVRRMCCDAALIPAVLGAEGAILDWGRSRRLASPDQVRYLRQRDKGCTFPGCARPPSWTEAHHLDEWLTDRGDTNVDRLALLCCRHHDIVHSHHLKGELRHGRIHWTRRAAAPRGPERSEAGH